jgi:hypothetical protein
MCPCRWPTERPRAGEVIDRGELAVLIVVACRWLVTFLLTIWGYLE